MRTPYNPRYESFQPNTHQAVDDKSLKELVDQLQHLFAKLQSWSDPQIESLFATLSKSLDKPLVDAIDNGVLGLRFDRSKVVSSLQRALVAGQRLAGTEPRAAIDLATRLLGRL